MAAEPDVHIARQFLAAIALSCTAIACAVGSSMLANEIAEGIRRPPAALPAPPAAPTHRPAPIDRGRFLLENSTEAGHEPAVDLYGNEVSDAVATYSIEPGGEVVEEHSPRTQMARLASPTS